MILAQVVLSLTRLSQLSSPLVLQPAPTAAAYKGAALMAARDLADCHQLVVHLWKKCNYFFNFLAGKKS